MLRIKSDNATTTRRCQRFATLATLHLILLGGLDAAEVNLDFDGVRINCIDTGRGPAVLLVHGYTANWRQTWQEPGMIDGLVQAGFRVIALDLRGHGNSSRPQGLEDYGLKMVADLKRVLDHFEIEQGHVVGYSMGSVIVNKFRDLHPARTASVVLGGYGNPPLPTEYSPELEQEIATNLQRMGLEKGNDARALGLISLKWKEWHVSSQRLRDNQIPAFIVIGQEDPFLDHSKRLAAELAHSKLMVVPGNHGQVPVSADFRNGVVGFVKRIESQRAADGDE